MNPTKAVQSTAYHEASHAVVAWKFRIPFDYAEVRKIDNILGHVLVYQCEDFGDMRTSWLRQVARRDMEQQVICAFAGHVVGEIYPGLADETWLGSVDDFKKIRRWIRSFARTEKEFKRTWMRLYDAARKLLMRGDVWAAVKAVAEELSRCRSMTFAEVDAVIRKASPRLRRSRADL